MVALVFAALLASPVSAAGLDPAFEAWAGDTESCSLWYRIQEETGQGERRWVRVCFMHRMESEDVDPSPEWWVRRLVLTFPERGGAQAKVTRLRTDVARCPVIAAIVDEAPAALDVKLRPDPGSLLGRTFKDEVTVSVGAEGVVTPIETSGSVSVSGTVAVSEAGGFPPSAWAFAAEARMKGCWKTELPPPNIALP
ncbi:MAG TPA: hypothetical protein PLO65_12825 [Caulobacter sp.]|nr:hypothetical protein [Caulobacter sp.]